MRWPALTWALAMAACGGSNAGSADAGATASQADAGPVAKVRHDGRLIIEDAFVPVVPLLIHEAKMDLFVSCRQVQDQAKAAGHELPLCYEPTRRAKSAVTVIRVEHQPGATVDAMQRLGAVTEGAHFLVEKTGSTFQLMDLAYAVRRDGANRGDEIRILAMGGKEKRGAAAATEPLLDELRALYPQARVEQLDIDAVTPPQESPPTPGAQP